MNEEFDSDHLADEMMREFMRENLKRERCEKDTREGLDKLDIDKRVLMKFWGDLSTSGAGYFECMNAVHQFINRLKGMRGDSGLTDETALLVQQAIAESAQFDLEATKIVIEMKKKHGLS